jgi:hypothetical protein
MFAGLRRAAAAAFFGIQGGYGGGLPKKSKSGTPKMQSQGPQHAPGETPAQQAHRQNQAQQRKKK